MTVADQLIKAAKDLGLPPKTEQYIRSADKAVTEAVHKAATYADSNRDTIAGYVDKAGDYVDDRTNGKYRDKVTKAKAAASAGVDKFAEKGSQYADGATAAPTAGPAPTSYAGTEPTNPPAPASASHAGSEPTTPVWDNPTDLDQDPKSGSTQA